MRYIPHTSEEIEVMLHAMGQKKVEDLFASIPANLKETKPLNLPPPLDEMNLLGHLNALAEENQTLPQNRSFIGGGVYRHFIPSAVGELTRRSEFLTPYTPYQPEIAQGTLQVMFEFQTMVAEIFGMEVANASLYDGSTSLAEAILMALRLGKGRETVLLPTTLHPQYREVVQTTLRSFKDHFVSLPFDIHGGLERGSMGDYLNKNLACLVLPYPNFLGIVEEVRDIVEKVHEAGGLVIFCVTEPLSLGLFESPGALGADIVCGEGQSMGLTPSFGGPYAGLFATRQEFVRQMPGRLCGRTTDKNGKPGFVLTLSTREQHIRREKATSNICTNQALCATQMTIYLSLLGKGGFQKLAQLNWQRTEYAKEKLTSIPKVTLAFPNQVTFNEFVLALPEEGGTVLKKLWKKNFDGGIALGQWYPKLSHHLLVSLTEKNGIQDINDFADALREVLS